MILNLCALLKIYACVFGFELGDHLQLRFIFMWSTLTSMLKQKFWDLGLVVVVGL
jgi:hypothetical protein